MSSPQITEKDIENLVGFVNLVMEKATITDLSAKETLKFGTYAVGLMDLKHKLDHLIKENK